MRITKILVWFLRQVPQRVVWWSVCLLFDFKVDSPSWCFSCGQDSHAWGGPEDSFPWKRSMCANQGGVQIRRFFALNRGEMTKCSLDAPLPTLFPSHTLSSAHHQPSLSLPSHSPTPTSSPCHVATAHVHSLSISFSRAPLISPCSRMWAERAASPTPKNNHFSVTGMGGAWKGCVSVVVGDTYSSQAEN